MILKDLKNNEKGSITVFVLATMLLVTGVIFIAYFSMMNKSSSQASQIEKIQEEYNQSNAMMSQAYDEAYGGVTDESLDEPTDDPSKFPTASTLEEGEWVYYEDAKGTTRKYVVLWDESSGYGIQIISGEIVDAVELGNGTGEIQSYVGTSMNSYNSAINTLNSKAITYLNETYATDARCVGTVPNSKNSESTTYFSSSYSFMSSYNGKFKNADENYNADYNQMKRLGVLNIGYTYWLASREIDTYSDSTLFNIRSVDASSAIELYNLCEIYTSFTYTSVLSRSHTYGLRPVFTLKDEVKITGGSGTKDDPYTLGV